MRKLLIFTIAIMSAISVSAQTPTIGTFMLRPMIGITMSSFGVSITQKTSSGEPVASLDSKYKTGFSGGLEIGYQLNDWFQPSVGMFYSQQGSKLKYEDFESNDEIAKIKTDYLTIPILANFYVFDGFALKTGIQPAILLNDSYSNLKSTETTNYIKKFQIQIPVGVSYQYKNFVIDARAMVPITKVFNKDKLKDALEYFEDSQNNAFSITIGYNLEVK